MPPKIEDILEKNLGKGKAAPILAKVEKLRQKDKSAAEIEKLVEAAILKQFEKVLVADVVTAGGVTQSQVKKAIQVHTRSRLEAISKVWPCISVKGRP